MDPFLPGEIPVMVLRYLAANKCESAALSMIEEMPLLKAYVPPKPLKVSNTDYLRHLARSSVNPGLKDVLTDYGNSKLLAEEIMEEIENCDLPSLASDSLVCKIKSMHGLIRGTKSANPVGLVGRSPEKPAASITVPKIDSFTNTGDDYQCPRCTSAQNNKIATVESGCQTEEYTAVQFGLQEDLPIIFYKTLLNDNNLQLKIAQTINEHMQVPQGQQNEDVVQKISSKAETEIDKFLDQLLQDIPEDSNSAQGDLGLNSVGNLSNLVPTSFPDDPNLSSVFREAEMLFGSSDHDMQVNVGAHKPSTSEQQETNKDLVSSNQETPPPVTKANEVNSSMKSNTDESNSSSITPQRTRCSSVKRITPTPLASASVNPVFNTSVVVEKQIFETRTQPSISKITVNAELPPWQKLHRRSIAPKIPGMAAPKLESLVSVVNKRNDSILGIGPSKMNKTPLKANINVAVQISSSARVPKGQQNQGQPSSSHKRKATPVKLTPEKARNIEYNFMHITHDTNKSSSTIKSSLDNSKDTQPSSSVKKTPSQSVYPPAADTSSNVKTVANSKQDNSVLKFNENSLVEVTPMQLQPQVSESATTSDLKTISPSALNRLIASANKLGQSSVAPLMNFHTRKKSYSTPRKRKHVRSLTFATPPSLKAKTPGSEPNIAGESQKRKAVGDIFGAELKSKKRLTWSENEKCKGKADPATVPSQSPLKSVTSEKFEVNKSIPEPTTKPESKSIQIEDPDPGASKLSMPTIFEESINEQQTFKVPQGGTSTPGSGGFASGNPICSPRLAFISVPSTDGIQYQYFHVSDDMQSFVPIRFLQNFPGDPMQGPVTSIQPGLSSTIQTVSSVQSQISQSVSVLTGPNVPVHTMSIPNSVLPSHSPSQPSATSLSTQPNSLSVPELAFPSPQTSSVNSFAPVPPSHPPSTVFTSSAQESSPLQLPKTFNAPLPPLPYPQIVPPLPPPPPPPPESESPQRLSATSTLVTVFPLSTAHNPPNSTSENVPVNASLTTSISSSRSDTSHETSKGNEQDGPSPGIIASPPSHLRVHKPQRRKSSRITENQRVSDAKSKETAQVNPVSLDPSQFPPLHDSGRQKELRKKKSKGEKAPAKKPKVTLNIKDLFGDKSPVVKSKIARSGNNSQLQKRSPEAILAQAVAAEAIPLGTPRRSPRRHPAKIPQHHCTPIQKALSQVDSLWNEKFNQTAPVTTAPPPPPPQQQENIQFSIVPAPLGFPEPTPIKNFGEMGFLNITSETGGRSPLITPLKSVPPANFNDTQFTLPPTPRVIEDPDSNSNSMHSLKLLYDGGMYPVNLLTSTPMKPGPPRTPGKGSSSSNSHSPILVEKNDPPSVLHHPQLQQQVIPTVPEVVVPPMGMDLSSPRTGEKSDGELSSSSDSNEGEVLPQKPAYNNSHSHAHPHTPAYNNSHAHPQTPVYNNRHAHPQKPTSSSHPALRNPQAPLSRPYAPIPRQQPQLPPTSHPHISVKLSSNLKQTHGIKFQVGGRDRHLTMSEQQTVSSLLTIGNGGLENVPLPTPVPVLPPKPQNDPKIPHNPHHLLQNRNLGDLVKFVRRKIPHPPK